VPLIFQKQADAFLVGIVELVLARSDALYDGLKQKFAEFCGFPEWEKRLQMQASKGRFVQRVLAVAAGHPLDFHAPDSRRAHL
jgi:hypothetical protein